MKRMKMKMTSQFALSVHNLPLAPWRFRWTRSWKTKNDDRLIFRNFLSYRYFIVFWNILQLGANSVLSVMIFA
jgi:hypothetical protein